MCFSLQFLSRLLYFVVLDRIVLLPLWTDLLFSVKFMIIFERLNTCLKLNDTFKYSSN